MMSMYGRWQTKLGRDPVHLMSLQGSGIQALNDIWRCLCLWIFVEVIPVHDVSTKMVQNFFFHKRISISLFMSSADGCSYPCSSAICPVVYDDGDGAHWSAIVLVTSLLL